MWGRSESLRHLETETNHFQTARLVVFPILLGPIEGSRCLLGACMVPTALLLVCRQWARLSASGTPALAPVLCRDWLRVRVTASFPTSKTVDTVG